MCYADCPCEWLHCLAASDWGESSIRTMTLGGDMDTILAAGIGLSIGLQLTQIAFGWWAWKRNWN